MPDVCKHINRKLGGPKIISIFNDKAKLVVRSIGTAKRDPKRDPKPGTATKRPIRVNPARSAHNLERALSKELLYRRSVSRGPPTALELMRSATTTAPIPTFKREGSLPTLPPLKREPGESQLLGMAARAISPAAKSRPTGVFAHSASIGNIDDKTAKRKTASQAELEEAILGIRKPNRQRASRAISDAAEQRLASGESTSHMIRRIYLVFFLSVPCDADSIM